MKPELKPLEADLLWWLCRPEPSLYCAAQGGQFDRLMQLGLAEIVSLPGRRRLRCRLSAAGMRLCEDLAAAPV